MRAGEEGGDREHREGQGRILNDKVAVRDLALPHALEKLPVTIQVVLVLDEGRVVGDDPD